MTRCSVQPETLCSMALEADYVVVDVGSQERPLVTVADHTMFPANTLWVCIDKDPEYFGAKTKIPDQKNVVGLELIHKEANQPNWLLPPESVDEVYFGNVFGEPDTDNTEWMERIMGGSRRSDKEAAALYGWKLLKQGGVFVMFEDITPHPEISRHYFTLLGATAVEAYHGRDIWKKLIQKYHRSYEDTHRSVLDRLCWTRPPSDEDLAFFMTAVK